jgi:hypothetical protein
VPDGAQWVRINDLFHAAIAKPAAARAPFLSEQCGSDALLRVEVESLLAAHRKGQTDVRPGAVAVGSRPGDYEVTGFIAEGEVYRARDTKLGQMLLSALRTVKQIWTHQSGSALGHVSGPEVAPGSAKRGQANRGSAK